MCVEVEENIIKIPLEKLGKYLNLEGCINLDKKFSV